MAHGISYDVGRSRIPIAPTPALNATPKCSVVVANEIFRGRYPRAKLPWSDVQEPSRRTHQPALARSPQPRPAPTGRALPPELLARRGSKTAAWSCPALGAHSSRRVTRRAAFPIPPACAAPMTVRRRAATADAAERLQPFSFASTAW